MSTITLIGAGQMASALTFPLYENGHEVRLVGSPLDDQVIDRLREDNYHVNLLAHYMTVFTITKRAKKKRQSRVLI